MLLLAEQAGHGEIHPVPIRSMRMDDLPQGQGSFPPAAASWNTDRSKITGWRQDGQRNAMDRFASSIITVTSGGVSPTVFCRFVCRLVWVVRLIWVVLLYYTTISSPCQRGKILPPEGRWGILAQRGDPP